MLHVSRSVADVNLPSGRLLRPRLYRPSGLNSAVAGRVRRRPLSVVAVLCRRTLFGRRRADRYRVNRHRRTRRVRTVVAEQLVARSRLSQDADDIGWAAHRLFVWLFAPDIEVPYRILFGHVIAGCIPLFLLASVVVDGNRVWTTHSLVGLGRKVLFVVVHGGLFVLPPAVTYWLYWAFDDIPLTMWVMLPSLSLVFYVMEFVIRYSSLRYMDGFDRLAENMSKVS